ncbi:hypothetical protein L198_00415 [Cryptococcus wingfieldii CBS 7118]|uniref:Uncharacterized protein n=1 Tax=Cryptococcus wingfieldii CBS 7118 TaxID=1295528 RepID=A0A1E3K8W3_9TREE|nr:hypothetical protein L198_00415 [Cryptococcus wingfieldii CBS 7118]ODO08682.1 hypothetical protein L198_00415 [Cryptococcus wingfieldii CBS 7118]
MSSTTPMPSTPGPRVEVGSPRGIPKARLSLSLKKSQYEAINERLLAAHKEHVARVKSSFSRFACLQRHLSAVKSKGKKLSKKTSCSVLSPSSDFSVKKNGIVEEGETADLVNDFATKMSIDGAKPPKSEVSEVLRKRSSSSVTPDMEECAKKMARLAIAHDVHHTPSTILSTDLDSLSLSSEVEVTEGDKGRRSRRSSTSLSLRSNISAAEEDDAPENEFKSILFFSKLLAGEVDGLTIVL